MPGAENTKARLGRAFGSGKGGRLVAGTSRAAGAGLGFVHLQVAALEVGSIEGFDRLTRTFFVHFNKAKPTGATGFTIFDDVGGIDLAVLRKEGMQIRIRSGPGQVANIDVLRQDTNSKEKKVKRKLVPDWNQLPAESAEVSKRYFHYSAQARP